MAEPPDERERHGMGDIGAHQAFGRQHGIERGKHGDADGAGPDRGQRDEQSQDHAEQNGRSGWNGYLVTLLRLPPFIVTLGTWNIFFALNLWYSGAQSIRSQDIDAAASLLKFFGENVGFLGAQFTYGSFLMIVIFAILWYMLNRTAWGRHVYAVGDEGGRGARRHPHRQDPDLGLCAGRPGLRDRRLGSDRPGRVGLAAELL